MGVETISKGDLHRLGHSSGHLRLLGMLGSLPHRVAVSVDIVPSGYREPTVQPRGSIDDLRSHLL